MACTVVQLLMLLLLQLQVPLDWQRRCNPPMTTILSKIERCLSWKRQRCSCTRLTCRHRLYADQLKR